MTEILHLMRLASPAKGLPALLAAFFAALSGIALIGAAAWIIASAALAPPLSALTLGITCVRAAGVSRSLPAPQGRPHCARTRGHGRRRRPRRNLRPAR